MPCRELGGDTLQLLLQPTAGERLAAQSPAADGSAPDGEIHAGIAEATEDFSLITSSVTVRPATRWVVRSKAPGIWRTLFDGTRATYRQPDTGRLPSEHERVVRVQPERHLLVARPAVERRALERRQIGIQGTPVALQGPVVDEPVTNVQLEQWSSGRCTPSWADGVAGAWWEANTTTAATRMAHGIASWRQETRQHAGERLWAFEVDRWPAPVTVSSRAPGMCWARNSACRPVELTHPRLRR